MYVETDKPESLEKATQTLYYMYANGNDTKDGYPIFRPITTQIGLETAYKVYYNSSENK